MRGRFCTREVPGRWSLQSFFDDCSHFQKKETYTGFTNGSKTITKTIICGIKNGLCETRPFFPFSSPFPLPFLSLSSPFPLPFLFLSSPFLSFFLSIPFPSPFLFPFLFLSFPLFLSYSFPFLFLSFSFSFFLSLSFSSPFPTLSFPFLCSSFSFSLCSLMWILWSMCEASAWKNDKRKKTIMCEKNIWKGSGFLPDPIWSWMSSCYKWKSLIEIYQSCCLWIFWR